MKAFRALATLTVLFTTSLAFSQGRNVGPIGLGSPDKNDIAIAKTLGLKLGQAYSINRDILLRTSWTPDTEGGDRPPLFKAYPEISCGSGYDARCQAVFSKNGKLIELTVDQNKKNLPLVHVSED